MWQQIASALCGLLFIGVGFGNLKGYSSRFVVHRHIVEDTDEETRKKYQKSIFAPYVIFGLSFIVFSFTVPHIQNNEDLNRAAVIVLAGFVIFFIWLLVCNKKYLGRFSAPNFKKMRR